MEQISLNDLISQISMGLDAVEMDLLGATPLHSKRVAVFSIAIAKVLGYDTERLFSLAGCALLHDNALTEYILSEQPNREQTINLRSHCIIGQKNCSYFPFPQSIDGFIMYHHENADGSGIFGKTEDEYPEEAGIIALADQIDVTYRPQSITPYGIRAIYDYIALNIGTRFSKRVGEAALEALSADLIESISDERIHDTLRFRLPEVITHLTNRELLSLSGIIAKVIDYKSAFTKNHTMEIANKAWFMSGVYGYNETSRTALYQAAAMHDIGKLFIPTAILEKPGKLTDEEFTIIKSHVSHSWELLNSIRGFEKIAYWACNHHEKLDGSGYPFGRKASELDFNCRLLTCLDIYQAVSEPRPYHAGRSHHDTMSILYDMARKGQIDPDITSDLGRELAVLERRTFLGPVRG